MEHKKLHISLFPAGGVEVASSRIRVFEFQSALSKLGIETTLGYSLNANVLFFQKKVTRENLWQARIAKALGRSVIYDVDDLGDALWYWVPKPYFHRMLRIADAITTCSEAQLQYLKSEYKSEYDVDKTSVILPAIDYFPYQPIKQKERPDDRLKLAWFGNSSNLNMFKKYLDVINKIPNIDITIISDKYGMPEIEKKYPYIKYIQWSLCDIISSIKESDITVLTHDGSREDLAKGNNKMIASITWGVPAIVSRTPEYERTAREAGIEYAVFSNENDLPEVLERLRTYDAREKYLKSSQPIIWEKYSPNAIAKQYVDLISKTNNKK